MIACIKSGECLEMLPILKKRGGGGGGFHGTPNSISGTKKRE